MDLFNYRRRESSVNNVGATPMGGDNPIRIQSMTTTPTTDTEASVAQAKRIIEAGGEYVRLTTQGVREAENLKNINAALRAEGITTPLVADVHFNPNVADVAALYAEKVRVNPGNYIDPARTFKHLEYTDEEYAAELKRLEERFVPFLNICKENHTAVRIGVNHGSLSDRIMSRYGDTPEGIVESCMEFLRICKKQNFNDVVISIKASNTVVMVRSMRLLVSEMDKENMHYPLHLGDTIRVSLSEEPEAEIPVARHLVDYVTRRAGHMMIPAEASPKFDWLRPERRATDAVENIGGTNVPVVIVSELPDNSAAASDNNTAAASANPDLIPDYIYVGENLPENRPANQKYIVDFSVWDGTPNTYPIFPYNAVPLLSGYPLIPKFLVMQYGVDPEEYVTCLMNHPEVVVVCVSHHQNRLGEQRALVHEMMRAGLRNPIVFCQAYRHSQEQKGDFQLEAAADMGALMFDGLTDGIGLMNDGTLAVKDIAETSFGILQAARLRTTKTEYISCPGCGRTLYDLRTTIARIKAATAHLKGLKIGIMGCIVNGPGEMADADYGYVGAGRGKISLYRRKECVAKNIPEEEAVERLLQLINEDNEQL